MRKLGKYGRYVVSGVVFLGFLAAFSGLFAPAALLGRGEAAPAVLTLLARRIVPLSILFLLLILAVTLLWGRLYCSFCCPLGVWQDIFCRLGHLFRPYKVQKPFRKFRMLWFGLFAGLFLAGGAVWAGFFEPFTLFGRGAAQLVRRPLAALLSRMEWLFVETGAPLPLAAALPAGIFLLVIAIAAAWKGRVFCNTLCPVGLGLGCLSRCARKPLSIASDRCVSCGQCAKVCKAGCIDISAKKIDPARCIGCLDCFGVCRKNAIGFGNKTPVPADPARRKLLLLAGLGAVAGAGAAVAGRHLAAQPAPENFPLMPPGAGNADDFLKRCTGCQLCVANCSGKVLTPALFEYGIAGMGQIRLSLEQGFCSYDCNRCTSVCPTGALQKLSLAAKRRCKLGQVTYHRSRCVVVTADEDCGACAEHCPTGALMMAPYGKEGLTIPKLTPELCIGCGACQYICPVTPEKAVTIRGVARQTVAADPKILEQKKSESLMTRSTGGTAGRGRRG